MAELRYIRDSLVKITSPGHRRRQHLKLDAATYHIGVHVSNVRRRLIIQAERELRFSTPLEKRPKKGFRAAATRVVYAFLKKLPDLIRRLEEDLAAAFYNDPAAKNLELILGAYPGIAAIRVYRVAHELHKLGLPTIARMMAELAHTETGIDIHPAARIGKRFFIDHGTGVVIGETTVIGNDVVLYQGVTLGARKFERDEHHHVRHDAVAQRHPTIGDNVTIYANATVLGGDTVIGHHAVIGATARVKSSVPPHTIVMPEEPRQTSLKNRAEAPVPPMDEADPSEISDVDWFQLYYDNIARCDDH